MVGGVGTTEATAGGDGLEGRGTAFSITSGTGGCAGVEGNVAFRRLSALPNMPLNLEGALTTGTGAGEAGGGALRLFSETTSSSIAVGAPTFFNPDSFCMR